MSAGQAAASCTLTPAGAVADVPVGQKCTVTYTFNTSASGAATLQIPYAVEINGTVLPEFAEKPRCLGNDRKIKLKVEPGTKVALYLNSDARPGYRTEPVYAGHASARDVQITITERLGRSNTETPTLGAPLCIQGADGKRFDKYDAALTGDIWMKISHRYTREEAGDILAAHIDPIIRAGVLAIYAPLASPTLTVKFPASASLPAQVIILTFVEQTSVYENISYCPLLSQVLTRTHPNCYLALISEARAAGVTKLRVNSAWRPSLGSIVHRAGLGLDVDYIESPTGQLSIERKALLDRRKSSGANVSLQEKKLFTEMQQKKLEANNKKDEADKLAEAARQAPGNAAIAEKSSAAWDAEKDARMAFAKARESWEKILEATEPALMKSLRSRLSTREDVRQILDPWYLDFETGDMLPGRPNEQRPGVELGHNNHIHITIKEARIL